MGRPFQAHSQLAPRERQRTPLLFILWNLGLMVGAIALAGGAVLDWWTRRPTNVWVAAIAVLWCASFVVRRLRSCTDRWPA